MMITPVGGVVVSDVSPVWRAGITGMASPDPSVLPSGGVVGSFMVLLVQGDGAVLVDGVRTWRNVVIWVEIVVQRLPNHGRHGGNVGNVGSGNLHKEATVGPCLFKKLSG